MLSRYYQRSAGSPSWRTPWSLPQEKWSFHRPGTPQSALVDTWRCTGLHPTSLQSTPCSKEGKKISTSTNCNKGRIGIFWNRTESVALIPTICISCRRSNNFVIISSMRYPRFSSSSICSSSKTTTPRSFIVHSSIAVFIRALAWIFGSAPNLK